MFDVKMTINGKPTTEISDEVEKAMIEGIRETIQSAITADEARQITVNLTDTGMNVDGPEEIVKKVKTALE